MKYILFFSLALFIVFNSCNESEQGIDPPLGGTKYPTKLNTRWEYNTTTTIEYYDTTGQISGTETLDYGNTVVKIIKINDTLGLYNNLIKFETYDLSTPANIGYHWYSNTDTAFIAVAYLNAGPSQWVIPKINVNRYLTFEELKDLINSPEQNFFSLSSEIISDSIIYETYRKVLAYPLAIKKRWVELIQPWYRERFVDKIVNVNFNGQFVSCYGIKVDWPGFKNIELNDFVSLTHGLVRREILADSITITDPVHPDSGLFGRISSYSNLVRINQ